MKTAIILAVTFSIALAQNYNQARQNYPSQNPAAAYHHNRQHQQNINRNSYSEQDQSGTYQQPQQQQQPQQDSSFTAERRSTTTPIPIIHWNKQQEHDGTYRTNYETGNNIIAEESGYIKTVGQGDDQTEALVQQGSYSYTSPDGQLITIHYTADETGFHAVGDHIPTPPPVSEEIQKGLDLIYAGIRQRQEEEARQAQFKNQQPLSQQIDRNENDRRYHS